MNAATETYVTIGEAARRLGTTGFTLRSRIRAGELPVYVNPLDRRGRLLAVHDLERYAAPRPIAPRREEVLQPA